MQVDCAIRGAERTRRIAGRNCTSEVPSSNNTRIAATSRGQTQEQRYTENRNTEESCLRLRDCKAEPKNAAHDGAP